VAEPGNIPERVNQLENDMAGIRRQAREAHTISLRARKDVVDFRSEMRVHAQVLSAFGLAQAKMREEMREGFADMRREMRAGFAKTNQDYAMLRAGMERITEILATEIAKRDQEGC
jgi:hypothetical protein